MNYCSHCGSEHLIFAIPKGDTIPRHICGNCDTIHYQNPKIIVGCLATYEDKVLLCKRGIEPRYGFWNLPGGFMENGETVEEGALRETREETEAIVQIKRLHSVYNLPHVNQVYLHFLAEMEVPHFTTTPESIEVELFHESEIPWNEIAFSSTRFSLEKFFEDKTFPSVRIGEYRKR